MKWVPVMEKVNRRSMKFLGLRGIHILWVLITLLLLSAANSKWTG